MPTYGTASVSQFSIALLLEICHHIGHHSASVHAGNWASNPDWCYWDYPLIELKGKAMGIIGFLAGVLFRRGWLRRSRAALCVFGAISAVLIYGGIMNPVSALLYARTLEWKVIAAYYVTGFPMDCVHAAATVFFLLVLAEPMLEKLDRIKIKYGLVE